MDEFIPNHSYLLIFNLDNGLGILHKCRLISKKKSAFIIKDYIDCKFMRSFRLLKKKGKVNRYEKNFRQDNGLRG